ncbi:uncharacterized protein BJ171DRAFT_471944 [Polychytrium aggregatum]|uniref:uncharacterized protein n=1 Tax=Polychytrium aggregatum TaxID=110093 RepID=UPI0022FEFB4C|nr:uncharacterized protein BJ171DRAFT_471944 [Polychytrium aggregatum]KAI9208269.1 hypothetical protein BJ171DRAFT_471944 [Polychytrium aggregatum]
MALRMINQTLDELKAEQQQILAISAHFALFVKANGIVHFNDAILNYIDHLIKQARDSTSATQDQLSYQAKIDGLEKMREKYNIERKLLTEGVEVSKAVPTPEEIEELIKTLSTLKYNGEFFATISTQATPDLKVLHATREPNHVHTCQRGSKSEHFLISGYFAYQW